MEALLRNILLNKFNPMKNASIGMVDYRNATYTGGKGMLLTDNNTVFIGDWQDDVLINMSLIWLDYHTYILANYMNGALNGDYVYVSPTNTIYTSFKDNRSNGSIVKVDHKLSKASLI
jgi:hypothetical protein